MSEPSGTVADPFRIFVPESAWREQGSENDPRVRLGTTLAISTNSPEWNSTLYMHLEAWAVTVGANGVQHTDDYTAFEDDLALLHNAVSADGHFETLTIRGREYVVLASPFC